jgi:uncharacterized membrane protein
MAEREAAFTKGRLEAFSDGVIAVIITIMVLDLKAPASAEPADLFKLWPAFSIYLISFGFVAIYWVNHHSLIALAREVNVALLWSNNLLLLFLSLIPFATAYVADTDLAPFPTAVYGALQFACGGAFALTLTVILHQRRDEAAFVKAAAARRRKNFVALAIYAAGTALALVSPAASIILFAAVAVAYVAPSFFSGSLG